MKTRSNFLWLALFLWAPFLPAQTMTKIVDHGPDSQKMVLAVLGDGYARADQRKYRDDVNTLIVKGLLAHDFYQTNAAAFNVYRIDLVSKDSGVSTLTTPKDTALKMIYSGDWNRCWMEESKATPDLVNHALAPLGKYDRILVILNEKGFGGCSEGSILFVTSGTDWHTAAHEYGHSIGSLYDEYWVTNDSTYTNDPVNDRNVCSILDRTNVAWAGLIDPATPVPTVLGPGIDPGLTVGMFEGAYYARSNIYRPSFQCRMREISDTFCPVCEALMQAQVDPYLKPPALVMLNAGPRPSYLQMVVQITDDGQSRVLKATELPGQAVLNEKPLGNFVYELSTTKQSLVAEALPEDPFIQRSAMDPATKAGHHYGHARSAIIVVKVPDLTLKNLPEEDLKLRLYQIEPGAHIDTVTSTNLQQLNAGRLLKLQTDFSRPGLRRQIMDNYHVESQ